MEKILVPRDDIKDHMDILEKYARNCTNLLELGCGTGEGSTFAFWRGMSANPHAWNWISVDRSDRIHFLFRPPLFFWSMVVGNIHDFITMEKVSKMIDSPFDLIFVDTVHEAKYTKMELDIWKSLASEKCTWLFHDTWMDGQYNPMIDVIKKFAEESGIWEYVELSRECNGLSALIPIVERRT